MGAEVVAVAKCGRHDFSKPLEQQIELIEGYGVVGDAHAGVTVKHRSRVARDPSQPNLLQVHLIHSELFDELAELGFKVTAGDLGENITTRGLDLLTLSEGTLLRIGARAVVRITGLRNPCIQIDRFQQGLMAATLARDAAGGLIRKAGVMGVVVSGGAVTRGDAIAADVPAGAHRPLGCV